MEISYPSRSGHLQTPPPAPQHKSFACRPRLLIPLFPPLVRRFAHLQTFFFLPFLDHITQRHSCPHFPQSRMPVRAYLDEYLLFWFIFLVTADLHMDEHRMISPYTRKNSSFGMIDYSKAWEPPISYGFDRLFLLFSCANLLTFILHLYYYLNVRRPGKLIHSHRSLHHIPVFQKYLQISHQTGWFTGDIH